MNRRTALALAAGFPLGIGLTTAAEAQPASTAMRLRGTVDAVTAGELQLTLRSSTTRMSVKVAPDVRVIWPVAAQPSDIKPGSYVGTAAIPQPDGTLRALEVQVFPPSMRGVGEGTRPWDTGAGSSMTNGTVGSLVRPMAG